MVKDYKHIHPVDWDEEHDDSDGGYSDYRVSDLEDNEEEGVTVDKHDAPFVHPGKVKAVGV